MSSFRLTGVSPVKVTELVRILGQLTFEERVSELGLLGPERKMPEAS